MTSFCMFIASAVCLLLASLTKDDERKDTVRTALMIVGFFLLFRAFITFPR